MRTINSDRDDRNGNRNGNGARDGVKTKGRGRQAGSRGREDR